MVRRLIRDLASEKDNDSSEMKRITGVLFFFVLLWLK